MVDSKLAGKTVLITESTRNFGKDLALAFAAEGSNLMLASRDNPEHLARLAPPAGPPRHPRGRKKGGPVGPPRLSSRPVRLGDGGRGSRVL